MAFLLLFLALFLEIAFAVCCLVTKKNYKRLKILIRVTLFIVFVVLIVSSVIIWSFRWAILAMLLFILAVKAIVSLIRNKPNTREYKASKIIWKTIIMTLALVFALLPAIVFPQHKLPKVTGKYEVTTTTYTYIDKNRIEAFTNKGNNRFVNLEFWYPKEGDGKYPLLVFSHGAYGIKASNISTYTELASHGYVVVSIDHPYHSFYTRSENGKTTMINTDYFQEISNMNKGIYSNEELSKLFEKWMNVRTEDMNLVIDTILEKTEDENTPIYRNINTKKIGVFGHSMGGAASVWLGRERDDISAVVNIDAPFFSELVYRKEKDEFVASNESYTIPLLNIYSDDVWGQLESNSIYVANKLNNKQFKNAYTTHLQGAKHLSLTDLPLFSPMLANILQGGRADIDQYDSIETENDLILKFLDDELKGIGQFAPNETY